MLKGLVVADTGGCNTARTTEALSTRCTPHEYGLLELAPVIQIIVYVIILLIIYILMITLIFIHGLCRFVFFAVCLLIDIVSYFSAHCMYCKWRNINHV